MRLSCFLILLVAGCTDQPGTPPARSTRHSAPAAQDTMLQENQEIALLEEQDIAAWVQRQGVETHRSGTGVRTHLYSDSAGATAVPGQHARVRFAVSLINGRRCYASQPGGSEEFLIEEDNVESGLHEAIQRMSVGDSAVIVIPSHRAHGLIGDQKMIPMRSTVIYHLRLVGLR